MNRAQFLKNWREGGNNYISHIQSASMWFGLQESVIDRLRENFGTDFNIVIWTNAGIEDDYYSIPFSSIEHLLIEENKSGGQYNERWTATIVNHTLRLSGNHLDISRFYAVPLILGGNMDLDEDYYIENARAEINIRLGQSKFRKNVLENFGNKCAITGISETELLVASHIVPWSKDKSIRGDVSNGICLYSEIDKLFDKGYISVSDEMKIIASPIINTFSQELQDRIIPLVGTRISDSNIPINQNHLEFHRTNILKT